jgi:hypothetical protein
VEVGQDCVVFSGSATLNNHDRLALWDLAKAADEDVDVTFDVEIIVGPTWRDVKQCSPMIAPRSYQNTNADEDDQQQWVISPCSWEEAEMGVGKRIRLKFAMHQRGEETSFNGIAYQVTATGVVSSS